MQVHRQLSVKVHSRQFVYGVNEIVLTCSEVFAYVTTNVLSTTETVHRLFVNKAIESVAQK